MALSAEKREHSILIGALRDFEHWPIYANVFTVLYLSRSGSSVKILLPEPRAWQGSSSEFLLDFCCEAPLMFEEPEHDTQVLT